MIQWEKEFRYNDHVANKTDPANGMPYCTYELEAVKGLAETRPTGNGYHLTLTNCHIRAETKPGSDPICHMTYSFQLTKSGNPAVIGGGDYHVYLHENGNISSENSRTKWDMENPGPNAKETVQSFIESSQAN